ncbi:hypothetical protein K227x_62070 [Rubripirellula lacrimiformis]|uniref:Uncharacterized protein n=1 Tax=Rubripirellula lacrimiformis TaxID=1930273 RepID=A0A517NL29_9BACT|nr:hypothetical protein K227x_62070 [Rubripirellula lacrimiformis]
MFGLNVWVQNIVFAWAGWFALWVMGFVGTLSIGDESFQDIRRFGINGIARPRFYFEWLRAILAILFLLWAPALTFAFFLPNLNMPFVNSFLTRVVSGSFSHFFSRHHADIFCRPEGGGGVPTNARLGSSVSLAASRWSHCVTSRVQPFSRKLRTQSPALSPVVSDWSCWYAGFSLRLHEQIAQDHQLHAKPSLHGFSSGQSTRPAR